MAKKTVDGVMSIRYLHATNSNLYDDGTTVAKLDGTEGDVMVYFPGFYYKCTGTSTISMSFSLNKPDGTWKESQECLIGAYKGVSKNYSVYSISGGSAVGPGDHLYNIEKKRGKGYGSITYELRKTIAWLFYGLYGTRDYRSRCGIGVSSDSVLTGGTNELGNTDTSADRQGPVNFLGLEGWWGDLTGEYIDNISASNYEYSIKRKDGSINKYPHNSYNATNWIAKIVAGEYADIVIKGSGASSTTYFCDCVKVVNNPDVVCADGLITLRAVYNGTTGSSCRICFLGVIKEALTVSAFKAIPVTN